MESQGSNFRNFTSADLTNKFNFFHSCKVWCLSVCFSEIIKTIILHRGVRPNDYSITKGGGCGVSGDPEKLLCNLCTTPYNNIIFTFLPCHKVVTCGTTKGTRHILLSGFLADDMIWTMASSMIELLFSKISHFSASCYFWSNFQSTRAALSLGQVLLLQKWNILNLFWNIWFWFQGSYSWCCSYGSSLNHILAQNTQCTSVR